MHSLFRCLLLAYPAAFRTRWRRDLLAFLDEEWRYARAAGGALWRTRFWMRAAADATAAGARLRWRRDRSQTEERSAGMWTVLEELRMALRGFVRAPGFHVLAALTVGMGVAATTSVFGVLDGVVLRPLPYPSSERLVRVATDLRMNPGEPGPMSHAAVHAIASGSRTLESVTALEVGSRVLMEESGPVLVRVVRAGPDLFDVLGARAAAGRLFVAADHAEGAAPLAVLAWETWATRYGRDPGVVGRTLRLDGETHEIVGVLERGFVPPEAADATEAEYWTNLALDPEAAGSFGAFSIARLRAGATPQSAEIEASGILQAAYAGEESPGFVRGARVIGLLEATIGPVRGTLWLVLGGVGLLLAIACANVANLMLARGTDRRGEVVLRSVLGASRRRIVAQQLAQSIVVALAGAVAGSALAAAALGLFRSHGPGGIPRLAEVSLDGRVLTFAVLLSVVAGLVFGLLPALQAARRAPAEVLRDGGRTSTSHRGARGTLIVAETAMAVVLVVVSGLLLNGFLRMRAVDPGYDRDALVALEVELRDRTGDAAYAYYDRLLETVRAVPGVRGAALSTFLPNRGFSIVQRYTVDAAAGMAELFLPSVIVSDDWMETTGARIVAGRDFDARDAAGSAPVVLVSESLAREHWPGETEIVGRRIKSGTLETADEPWYTVVGVVSDMRDKAADEPVAMIFHAWRQEPWRRISVLVRAQAEPGAVVPALRRAVSDVDATIPIRTLRTMRELSAETLAQPRFYTTLVAGFGLLALLLALVGIYGTTSYATSRRTREIGVRLALGGRPTGVAGLLVRDGVRLAGLGVALGIIAALAGTRLLRAYLFGVQPTDPLTFTLTVAAVLATAACAAWIPARRAARLDPSTALRADAAGGAA